ncbi:MAG: 2-oxo acid dehydrogenase subunit E2 [Chloroflexota bacterium]|nr:2-oxo acid dehydrogenase subunit E2 [Chloroflexota bacterium]
MATFELKMPKLGESVTEGTIGKWLKQPGDKVEKYDLLVEVQTDKVNTEIPSEVTGTLKEIKVQEGETVPVGVLLAVFETAQAEAAAAAPALTTVGGAGTAPAAGPRPAEPPAPAPAPAFAARPGNGRAATAAPANGEASDVRATPAVRKLASEHGIDITGIEGTGLNGRVSRKDVEDAIARLEAAPAPAPAAAPAGAPSRQAPKYAPISGDRPVKLTQMRRAIADNMVQAWTAPHAHAVMEVDMTALMKYREEVRHDFAAREGFDLSPAAFIVKGAVETLRAVPLVNASWTDQGIVLHGAANVGYAVALGDEGLVVPVIRAADEKSIAGLMRAIRDIVDRAKARKLTFEDFSGGTFTVNNTGPLGTIVSSPIVPPGQAAIVSSEAITKRLVVMDDDSIAIRWRMNLVIGFDHRVVDGATAARALAVMRDWLQAVGPGVTVY